MFEILKSIENQNCKSFGFCMIDPRINALYELLINEIRQISFYIVKIDEYKIKNDELLAKCIEGLSLDFSNINFNEKNFIDLYKEFVDYRLEIMKIYNKIHENSTISYETIKSPFNEDLKNSIIKMIKRGQKLLKSNYLFVNEEGQEFFELIQILIKNASRNISKIKDFKKDYTKYDFEVLRFLNITNFPSTRVEKLKRRIKEFVEIEYQIMRDLENVLEENYGKKTKARVNLTPEKGKSILVSGDNFKELEIILNAVKDTEINVYTHDMLFMAHSYPKFREYKNLKGHFGSNNPRLDFSNFKGVIYVTKNYEQRIDSIVKGCIYTSNPIMPKGISKIENENFEPLIKEALLHEGFEESLKESFIDVPYDEEKINVINENQEKITLVIGSEKFEEEGKELNLFFPSETSLIFDINNQKNVSSIIFSGCYIQTLILAFILKVKFDYKIKFAKCPNFYINPNLIKCLKNEYKIGFGE